MAIASSVKKKLNRYMNRGPPLFVKPRDSVMKLCPVIIGKNILKPRACLKQACMMHAKEVCGHKMKNEGCLQHAAKLSSTVRCCMHVSEMEIIGIRCCYDLI